MASQPNRFVVILAVLAMAAATAAGLYFVAQADRPAARQTDLRYAPASENNRLDIYLPAGDGPFPFVLDIHGGDFRTGDKADGPVPKPLLDLGVAVVRMNYRLASEAVWPAQRDDVLAAVTYLRAAGADVGLDPARFALSGQGAGGYLAVMAGIDLARQGLGPRAVVDFYGPVAFGEMDADMAALGRTSGAGPVAPADSAISQLLGYPVGGNRAMANAAGPVGALTDWPKAAPLPALMIRHGDADGQISHLQAGRLRDAWAAADPKAVIDFALVPGGDHGGGVFDGDDLQGQLAIFLAEQLR